jgi:VanZ family protein
LDSAWRPLSRLGLWQALATAYLGLIGLLSLLPPSGLPETAGEYDKWLHAAGYAVAGLWAVWLLRRGRPRWTGLGSLVVYGVVLELLQGLTGYRSADVWDAVANSGGVLLAAGLGGTPLADALDCFDAWSRNRPR